MASSTKWKYSTAPSPQPRSRPSTTPAAWGKSSHLGPSSPRGMVEQAFSLDGAPGTRVSIPDSANLRFAGSFTFDAWVKITSSGTQSGASFFADVLRKRHRDDGGLMDIGIGMKDNVTRFFLADDSGTFLPAGLQGTTVINDGQWHHIAGVRDTSANEVRLFVDGILEVSKTDTTGTFVEVNAVPWNIGNVPGSTGASTQST